MQGRPDIFKPGFGPELAGHVYEQFESDCFGVIVAVLDGSIAGFATVQYVHRPESAFNLPRDFYHVEEFGVDTAHRRKGVASALVEYMRSDARRRGFHRIDLDVWAFNDGALAFYESGGRGVLELGWDWEG